MANLYYLETAVYLLIGGFLQPQYLLLIIIDSFYASMQSFDFYMETKKKYSVVWIFVDISTDSSYLVVCGSIEGFDEYWRLAILDKPENDLNIFFMRRESFCMTKTILGHR